jgi:hypothetical protein
MVGKSLTPPVSPYYEAIPPAPPEWWNPNWTRRRAITITGYHPVDYQLKVVLPFYDPSIRFLENATSGLLPYWVESYTANSMTVWVKRAIENGEDNTIYVYYNNPNAEGAGDGDSTFDFFDDFPGSSLNSTKWTVESPNVTVTVSNGTVKLTATASTEDQSIYSARFSGPRILEALIRTSGTNYHFFGFDERPGYAGAGADIAILGYDGSWYWLNYRENNPTRVWTTTSFATWKKVKIIWTSTGVSYYANDALETTITTNVPLDPMRVRPRVFNSGVWVEVDYVFLRKYASPEPTTSVGNEEQYGG